MTTVASVSPDVIFETLFAYQQTAALKSAIELDLFTAIDEGARTPSAIAARVAATDRGVRILCDFLTTLGLLEKSDGQYALGPVSVRAFLVRTSPMYIGTMATFLTMPELKHNFEDLTGAVRRGGVRRRATRSLTKIRSGSSSRAQWCRWLFPQRTRLPASSASSRWDREGSGYRRRPRHVRHRAGAAQPGGADRRRRLGAGAERRARPRPSGAASMHATGPIAGDAFETDFGTDHDIALVTNFLHHFDTEQCTRSCRRWRGARPERAGRARGVRAQSTIASRRRWPPASA